MRLNALRHEWFMQVAANQDEAGGSSPRWSHFGARNFRRQAMPSRSVNAP